MRVLCTVSVIFFVRNCSELTLFCCSNVFGQNKQTSVESSDDDDEQTRRVVPKNITFRMTTIEEYDDQEFQSHFRMTRGSLCS